MWFKADSIWRCWFCLRVIQNIVWRGFIFFHVSHFTNSFLFPQETQILILGRSGFSLKRAYGGNLEKCGPLLHLLSQTRSSRHSLGLVCQSMWNWLGISGCSAEEKIHWSDFQFQLSTFGVQPTFLTKVVFLRPQRQVLYICKVSLYSQLGFKLEISSADLCRCQQKSSEGGFFSFHLKFVSLSWKRCCCNVTPEMPLWRSWGKEGDGWNNSWNMFEHYLGPIMCSLTTMNLYLPTSAGTLLWIYRRLIGRPYIGTRSQAQIYRNISDPLGKLATHHCNALLNDIQWILQRKQHFHMH